MSLGSSSEASGVRSAGLGFEVSVVLCSEASWVLCSGHPSPLHDDWDPGHHGCGLSLTSSPPLLGMRKGLSSLAFSDKSSSQCSIAQRQSSL